MHQGREVLAIWRSDAVALILFGLCGMLAVQYTYMAAIKASNTATATVLQFTAPAMIALWLALAGRRLPSARETAAIALAMVEGPAAGLAALDELAADARLAGNHRLDAARAHLLERMGDVAAAIVLYRRAADRTSSTPERNYLMLKAARLSDAAHVENV